MITTRIVASASRLKERMKLVPDFYHLIMAALALTIVAIILVRVITHLLVSKLMQTP